jgi:flagellar biosynthesis protein FlhF
MRSALRMVREELGEDAVILSNRRVANGIELLAAADMPPPPPPSAPVRDNALVRESRLVRTGAPALETVESRAEAMDARNAAADYPGTAARTQRSDDGGWYQMQQELRSMRDLIEQQYSNFAWQQYRSQRPAQAAMCRRLQRLGLDVNTVTELLEQAERNGVDLKNSKVAWQALMAQLSARIPATQDLLKEGGVFAFVGPSGAGKTTTIAKLAARYVLEHGNADIALITTDSYRIGAHEQLRTLSRILNVPCKVSNSGRDLANILYELRHCRLILIDTAGLNAKAPELREQLAVIDALGERAHCLQVLAANSQQQSLQAAQRAYHTGNLAGCILTKLDEAGSLGESISLLINSRLPLAYMADGQAIPGDIAVADAKLLVTKAIALAKQVECDEERLAEAFSARRGSAAMGSEKVLSA